MGGFRSSPFAAVQQGRQYYCEAGPGRANMLAEDSEDKWLPREAEFI